MPSIVRAAACHVSPVLLDAKQTTQKCVRLIHEAADHGAHLVIFPETFIPAFPFWGPIVAPGAAHEYFAKMSKESVFADGEEVGAIRVAARERNVMVSVGISEKVRYSSATMFNSNLIIDGHGDVVVHHRKLVPTFYEKMTWTPGDGHGLKVANLPIKGPAGDDEPVKFGTLICGENTNPLARYTMVAQGINLHISSWPATSIMGLADHVNDDHSHHEGETKDDDLQWKKAKKEGEESSKEFGRWDPIHMNRLRCGNQCVEGKCFGVISSAVLSPENIAVVTSMAPASAKALVQSTLEKSSQAETAFLNPSGSLHRGFTIDKVTGLKTDDVESLRYDEGILYADMDMDATIEGKQYHDLVGNYQRFDVFDLKVNTTRKQPVTFQTV
ncbi:hypothetical protein A1O3_08914 [Capronia epimyces CBS 606.96]|uniref:CN hydrolase domain-containing protein n=1 Tax=Capronia epimyces CBS 606.96 TaxID=1182542 RepID=W9XG04_9EURO|nr:uncharacterized protein A1O3_08914 [Capronia epimyces CBS 606.96]EXJ79412.1 hypothetical protein A1O3_08914 [Capronia epimyces CBS 606.96]